MGDRKVTLTVQGHIDKIYDMVIALSKKDYELDPPKTPQEIGFFKIINFVECCSSRDSFFGSVIGLRKTILAKMPTDEELAAFLSRCIKPQYHKEAYDIFEYFEAVLKAIQ